MPDVTSSDAPKSVRVAAALTLALALAGLGLIVAGSLDLHWWSTSSATKLDDLFAQIKAQYGEPPPALLRRGEGAVLLMVVGAVCLAYGMLSPLIGKGRRWARTWGIVISLATFFFGLVLIGADASQPADLRGYLDLLRHAGNTDPIPQVQALIYPGWYGWFEDLAQGLQVLASLAVAVALAAAAIWHPDHFASERTATAAPDPWDEAFTRIHRQTVRRPDDPQ
jgi:hypothetical protein